MHLAHLGVDVTDLCKASADDLQIVGEVGERLRREIWVERAERIYQGLWLHNRHFDARVFRVSSGTADDHQSVPITDRSRRKAGLRVRLKWLPPVAWLLNKDHIAFVIPDSASTFNAVQK